MKSTPAAQEIAGVRLTSPEKVLFPEQGVSKRELAEYYVAVSRHVLPHLKGRPLSLVRCPAGRQKQCFFQRHAGEGFPREVRRVRVDEADGPAEYVVAETLPALVALVQIGVLELHTWGARRDRLDRPDRVILDLDPGPDVGWAQVVAAAYEARERLRAAGLESWVKTTGGKGLHVVAPLQRRSGWEEVRGVERRLAEAMAADAPARFVAQAAKDERAGRIYVDYLRNGWGASAVAAYSTRARAGATVSVPVAWEELGPALRPAELTVRTVPARLAALGDDPWAGYAGARQTLRRVAL